MSERERRSWWTNRNTINIGGNDIETGGGSFEEDDAEGFSEAAVEEDVTFDEELWG